VKTENTNKMQKFRCLLSISDVYYQLLSQHVSDIIIPIIRRTKTVYYCIWCFALLVVDVAGCNCGALRCRMHKNIAREPLSRESHREDGSITCVDEA